MGWVRRELDALSIPPLKRFGQHFLIDKKVRENLVQLAGLTPQDTVLEVGPGLGFLTAALVTKASRLIAVEKDRTLAGYLTTKFASNTNLTVTEGDVLKIELPDFTKVVSSPPYNISSKLILLLLNSRFKRAVLLLQQEFVGRLMAPSGTREYGRLTVMFQSRAQATAASRVPSSAFFPRPRVESTIAIIEPKANPPEIHNMTVFTDLVRALFTQRRRKLRGVLIRYLKYKYTELPLLHEQAPLMEKRVFELSPEELADLSNQITDKVS
ncbi:MAG: 16S rRNA (adenine(1518)-N(6)/adenine(1519)-N(6))-dimethyltransferase RsmA [Candidatus Bathyarchaeia archaeon]|jgi:16S rRNA (adenine1518-N6/adenine1519-N6)-dimethyltransferase